MVMEPQMFFSGTFWHICIISARVWFSSIFPATSWWMSIELGVNKRKGPLNCSPNSPEGVSHSASMGISGSSSPLQNKRDNSNLRLCACREVLQEHPDLSSTSFYSEAACVLPAPLVQTPHPSRRASHGGGRTKDVAVWCWVCSPMCVCVCVSFVLWRRSVAPTKWCSQAWNHLSSALKGLHGFLMMSPYLLYAKYTQWLHSF